MDNVNISCQILNIDGKGRCTYTDKRWYRHNYDGGDDDAVKTNVSLPMWS